MLRFIWISDKQWIIFKCICHAIFWAYVYYKISCCLPEIQLLTGHSVHYLSTSVYYQTHLSPSPCREGVNASLHPLLISLIGQNMKLLLCHIWLTRMTGFHFDFHYLDPRAKGSLPFPLPWESPRAGLLMGQRLITLSVLVPTSDLIHSDGWVSGLVVGSECSFIIGISERSSLKV